MSRDQRKPGVVKSFISRESESIYGGGEESRRNLSHNLRASKDSQKSIRNQKEASYRGLNEPTQQQYQTNRPGYLP